MSQVVLNTIAATALIALVGISFGIIYFISRFFHFAHGLTISIGGYTAYALMAMAALPWWLATLCAVMAAVMVGSAMELGVYRHLRANSATPLTLLIASLGLYVAGESTIALIFGGQTLVMSEPFIQQAFGPVGWRFTGVQVGLVTAGVMALATVTTVFRRTLTGKNLRAVADNEELALAVGLRVDRLMLISFASGSALAGLVGALIALDVGLRPGMGLRPLLLGVVAVVIGGIGNIRGAACGALVLAVSQNVVSWSVGNAWQDGVAFALLVGFLVLRPEGLLGRTRLTHANN